MAFHVEIQPQALHDLDAIASYLRRESSPGVAKRWFNGIIDTLATLQQLPSRCPIAPESDQLGQEIRVLLHGKKNRRYKIYFAVDHRTPSTGTVHILHVRHWARQTVTGEELDDAIPE